MAILMRDDEGSECIKSSSESMDQSPPPYPPSEAHSKTLAGKDHGMNDISGYYAQRLSQVSDTAGSSSAPQYSAHTTSHSGSVPKVDSSFNDDFLSWRAWGRYCEPVVQFKYYRSLFHLWIVNFLVGLLAWTWLIPFAAVRQSQLPS